MLGLSQLCLLLYIRQQSLRNGQIDMVSVREYAKRELGIRSTDHVNITTRRLAERMMVDMKPCGVVSYINTSDNEDVIAANIDFCDRAVKLSTAS